jgi:hypothetical protein
MHSTIQSYHFYNFYRVAVHEGVVHRVRSPRHVGRDGIIRPSTAHETKGFDIFDVSF